MNKKIYHCSNRKEDGVALIFALTMLALLLIMLIGFLATSLLEQRTAYAIGDNTASRLLARGMLNRIKEQLSEYTDDAAWMRFRSSDGDVIAPIVSTSADGNLSKITMPIDLSESDEAYAALKPLLHRYFGGADGTASEIKKNWEWRNFFPSSIAADYPQWIYYYNNPNKDQITGRVAYVIVPNFGIDPLQLGKDSENKTRIGKNYKELKQSFFVQDTDTLNKYKNYLSLDFLTAKNALNDNGKFNLSNFSSDYKAGSFGGTNAGGYKEFVNLYFTTKQTASTESAWDGTSRTAFIFDTLQAHSAYKTMLDNVKFEPANLRDQVAANIRDYMDTDSTPTSDVTPANWLSNANTPQYTGNEKTPYINQIVPAVQLEADYSINKTSLGFLGSIITQNITIDKKLRVYVELINIYPEAITVQSIKLKNFALSVELSSNRGTFILGKNLNYTNNELTISVNKTVPAHGYATAMLDISLTGTNALNATANLTNVAMKGSNANADTINIEAKITKMSFDRAVLLDSSGNHVDCVDKLTAENLPYTMAGQNIEGVETWSFSTQEITKQRSSYHSFEVADPRCNLASDQWSGSWSSKSTLFKDSDVPNWGSVNGDVNASNNDVAESKDIQLDSDPAKMVAYIRNNVMKSPWELGYIHRGAPWQTINLKSLEVNSKGEPDKDQIDYLNDGLLMDKLKFTNDGSTFKFNINYPLIRAGIFNILLNNVRYHDSANINKLNMDESDSYTSALSVAAKNELNEYISMKYYDKKNKFYHHYVSRAQLVNVISNWARNGSNSPVKDLSDMHIEEFIGKIVPLTRCGETFEYFTAFVAAQSIKDVKGVSYVFDGEGKIDQAKSKNNCEHGKFDYDKDNHIYHDKITSETFLVARLRREVTDCKKYACCRQGIHSPDCKFKVTVIESYTVSEP